MSGAIDKRGRVNVAQWLDEGQGHRWINLQRMANPPRWRARAFAVGGDSGTGESVTDPIWAARQAIAQAEGREL